MKIAGKHGPLLQMILFEKGAFEEARFVYQNALLKAEVLNEHQSACLRLEIPFMQVFLISCNNLFNTYCELEQANEAEKMLQRAVYYLFHLSRQSEVNKNEIQNELKRASMALLNFAEKSGDIKKKEKLLANIHEQLLENKLLK